MKIQDLSEPIPCLENDIVIVSERFTPVSVTQGMVMENFLSSFDDDHDIKIRDIYRDYIDSRIEIEDSNGTRLQLGLKNYDAHFVDLFNQLTDPRVQDKLLSKYKNDKEAAKLSATKNAIWLAATSGDSQQLSILLEANPNVDINDTYMGKNILHAMFDADETVDLPFKNERPDYNEVISILSHYGLNKQMMGRQYECIQAKQTNSSFFQTHNPVELELLTLLRTHLGNNFRDEANSQFNLNAICNML